MQPVFSFKIRGAFNKMAHLSPDELDKGVVACSAGNHAQGVALSSQMLECRAVIVMPLATPAITVDNKKYVIPRDRKAPCGLKVKDDLLQSLCIVQRCR